MALFTFTNTKPPVDEIWRALEGAPIFDSLPNPMTSRTIVWVLFASTVNFGATKEEINKFVEGKIQFSVIEQGFLQSIAAKYGINLHIDITTPLDFTDNMSGPEKVKLPYLRFKRMFDMTLNSEASGKLLRTVVPNITDEDFNEFTIDIWGALSVNPYTIQTRFSEFLTHENFRVYFPAAPTTEETLESVLVRDITDLKSKLKERLLLANVTSGAEFSILNVQFYPDKEL